MKVGQLVFVHRYKWSHDSKRRRFRRLLKVNKVKLEKKEKDGFLYRVLEEIP